MEILDAAWETARRDSLAGLTLREVAERVGMQPPSLYSHFASKNAIYDAMFEQAWRTVNDQIPSWVKQFRPSREVGWSKLPSSTSTSPSLTWLVIS